MVRGMIEQSSPAVTGGLKGDYTRFERVFASSEGSSWRQTTYVTSGEMYVDYMEEPGYHKYIGARAFALTLSPAGRGWEYICESGILEQIPALIDQGEQTRDPIPVDVGRYDVVCSAHATAGLLANTVGTATELDRAMGFEANAAGTSYLDDPLAMAGTYQVGSPLLTVTANRSHPGGAATVRWDDEGVVPEEFTLVREGIVTDFQTTREQAAWLAPYYAKMGKPVRSHGCAGAPSGINVTLQQPPNLRIHGGAKDLSFDDLVAGTDKGIAVLGLNLMMDAQRLNGIGFGTFREIKNGKIGRFLAGGVLGVRTPELWKNLTALGGDASTRWYGMRREKGEPEQRTVHGVGAVPAKFANVAVVNFTGRM
jgi:TldD protein